MERVKLSAEYQELASQLDAATAKLAVAPDAERLAAATQRLNAKNELDAAVKRMEEADQELARARNNVKRLETLLERAVAAERQVKAAEAEAMRVERQEKLRVYREAWGWNLLWGKDEGVKPVGDETSLTLVKAKPQTYLNKPFIITGIVEMSDYYNFGYRDAKKTHYALRFRAVDARGNAGSWAWLYQQRTLGDDIVNVLTKEDKPDKSIPIRFKVTVSSDYVKTFDDAQEQYEVIDWQFLGTGGKLSPWRSEVR
ncbi:MAG: hypothetical protein PHU85_14020 [Phycisphaerae bacterium]|nr:hypothetical protein [Phycisphaerae bacterium]